MEKESLNINQKEQQQQKEEEHSLVPRNRPDIYTASELFRSVIGWTRPIWDVLTWQMPIVSSSWLILGLVAIYFLARISLPSLVGLTGLTIMGLVMLYSAVFRVDPYQMLRGHPLLAEVRVPQEAVDLVADRITNWVNRWVATGQYLMFGQDYRPSLMVSVLAFHLVFACAYFGSSTVIMMAYSIAFILPKFWQNFVIFDGNISQLRWPPSLFRMLFMNTISQLMSNPQLMQLMAIEEEENVPDDKDNAETQQPEVGDI